MQLLLRCREVNPPLKCLSGEGVGIIVEELLYHSTGPLELLSVPQKCPTSKQVAVRSHRLLLIQGDRQSVNSFLINVPAPLMIIYQSNCGCELYLSAFLYPGELTDSLRYATLLEDAEGLPENEYRVNPLLHFLHNSWSLGISSFFIFPLQPNQKPSDEVLAVAIDKGWSCLPSRRVCGWSTRASLWWNSWLLR